MSRSIALPVSFFCIGLALYLTIEDDRPSPKVEPRFAEAEMSSPVCYIVAEPVDQTEATYEDTGLAYRGCWSADLIEEKKSANIKAGTEWNYVVVAEFNRQRDLSGVLPEH